MADDPRGKKPSDLTRLPEMGRIRMGAKRATKTGNTAPSSIAAFRFTSVDREALGLLAARYGGVVRAWDDDLASIRNQYEVYTEATSIDIILLPNAVDANYELWVRSGIARRCDGVDCMDFTGPDPAMVDCICDEANLLLCKPTTRIHCILPDVAFGGTWRLESHGRKAKEEIPAMAQVIEMLAATSGSPMVKARLGMKQVEKKVRVKGKVEERHYVVPTLTAANTLHEILSGQGNPLALGVPDTPDETMGALGPGWGDDIIEAELVEDDVRPKQWQAYIDATYGPQGPAVFTEINELADRLKVLYPQVPGDGEDFLDDVLAARTKGAVLDWHTLTEDQANKIKVTLEDLLAERLVLVLAKGGITGFKFGPAHEP